MQFLWKIIKSQGLSQGFHLIRIVTQPFVTFVTLPYVRDPLFELSYLSLHVAVIQQNITFAFESTLRSKLIYNAPLNLETWITCFYKQTKNIPASLKEIKKLGNLM